MLRITKIKPPEVQFWYKETFIGYVNEYEFNDLRIQIKDDKIEGYWVFSDDKEYHIFNNGRLTERPKCFKLLEEQLDILTDYAT